MYPYANNKEYEQLSYDYNVIDDVGMNNNCVVITKNTDYDGVMIKTLGDRYNEALKSVSN